MDEIVFTPSAVIDLLQQIDELSDVDVSLQDIPGQAIQISVGDSSYNIDVSQATDVEVPADVVEDVADVNVDAYSEMAGDSLSVEELDDIESGLLKEIAKTLAVGGLVRLTNKLLGRDREDDKNKR